MTDNARIYRAKVDKVVYAANEAALIALMNEARTTKMSLIAAGKRHSQGGQSFCEAGIVVDLTRFNQVIEINIKEKWIIVQSGISWAKIQEALNPLGLSVKVMQSSNIFTVGGSLSVNAHGRDPRYSSVSDTVEAIKVLTADGHARWIDRENETELFRLFIGGYGLFGFILEVKIQVTDNFVLDKSAVVLDPEDYVAFAKDNIIGHDDVNLHFARFNVDNDAPLSKLIAVTYRSRPDFQISTARLVDEHWVFVNKLLLAGLRRCAWVKKLAWSAQVKKETKPEVISRNNAMRPPILALDYQSRRDTDILQEYFVPAENFADFTRDIQDVLKDCSINLLNITVRHIKRNTDSILSYATNDFFAFVFYVNVGLSEGAQRQAEAWTRRLIDAALRYKGSYYLPYQRYATTQQVYAAYPQLSAFLAQKHIYDPSLLFQNDFYTYLLGGTSAKTAREN